MSLVLFFLTVIQTRSQIFSKDNSGIVRGRAVSVKTKVTGLGEVFKLSVSKAKSHWTNKQKGGGKSKLQDALLIQTKKSVLRLDGSSVKFNTNGCVMLSRSGSKTGFGFKRVNSCVPFELKKFHSAGPIFKLAKNQV